MTEDRKRIALLLLQIYSLSQLGIGGFGQIKLVIIRNCQYNPINKSSSFDFDRMTVGTLKTRGLYHGRTRGFSVNRIIIEE